MKILQVIDSLNIGGAEKVCRDTITMLLDAGHQADCMVISSRGALYDQIDHRATVYFLNRRYKYSLAKMRKCALLASKYDIVHVHMRHTWLYIKLALILFLKNPKLVFHDHFGDISIIKKVPYRLRWPFRPDHYIAVSSELAQWAKDNLGHKGMKIYLLRNTIIPLDKQSSKYSGDWILVSNLRGTKNQLFAIQLADFMQRRLVIFGNHDGTAYADRVLTEAGHSGNIAVVQNETNVQQYFKNFTMAIHVSISETGPLVLLEYMAHGLPFITTAKGEVVDQIKNVFPYLIAESFDMTEWEQKINLLECRIRNEGDTLATDLKRLFADKFSPEHYLEQCLKIYQNVLIY